MPQGPIPDVVAWAGTPASAPSGTVLTTLALPALPVATTVVVTVEATAQISASGTGSISVSASAGALTSGGMAGPNLTAGQWLPVLYRGLLTLPASTAAVLTISSTSTASALWRTFARASRQLAS